MEADNEEDEIKEDDGDKIDINEDEFKNIQEGTDGTF